MRPLGLLVLLLASPCCSARSFEPRGGSLRVAPTTVKPWQHPSVKPSHSLHDEESATKEQIDAFLTRDSRNTFIARVYALLATQLLITAGSVLAFGLNPSLSRWMSTGGYLVPTLSLILSSVTWFLACAKVEWRRQSPTKWNLLALFTLGEAVSVGFLSSFFKLRSVATALGITALAVSGISVYTATQKNPKYDLSMWGAGISSYVLVYSCAGVGMVFMGYGILAILSLVGVLPPGLLPYNDTVYGMLGASLFAFYIAHHTKTIVGGKHAEHQMNEKDYVFGAMTLYNDIINFFIYTLRVVGEDRD